MTNTTNTNEHTYKDRLDETAHRVKYGTPDDHENENGGLASQVGDKVSQYVPAQVGKLLGTHGGDDKTKKNQQDDKQSSSSSSANIPGPPDRPRHDTQIEEFVRDQHRSKTEDGTFALGS